MTSYHVEVAQGQRFEFGRNWTTFLESLTDERIEAAKRSLRDFLETDDLRGKTFIDIGAGSGLFSLAARMLGASVHSFDYDPQCVACTRRLKDCYFPGDNGWLIEEGSAMDVDYLARLGQFDIVYSWGVLQHTGDMWKALENVVPMVRPQGKLFIAIFNDQGPASVRWRKVKRFYNASNPFVRRVLVAIIGAYFGFRPFVSKMVRLQNPLGPSIYGGGRGMSQQTDLVDWVGGYPFEVAKPEEIFDFYRRKGFTLLRLKTRGGGRGCNQYVFLRGEAM
jgi:2-polyprenyl-3-methyl-5-hydroxy-6-metoxy-1,4-benzoquinol methylase